MTPVSRSFRIALLLLLISVPLLSSGQESGTSLLSQQLITDNFGNDAAWFNENIPLLEISDPEIQQIYYYRWKLYKAHLRDLGDRGYIVTEFLDDVGWQKHPYASLNDASGFHIYDGRWLKDDRYINDYIDYLYTGGGNDRHFSEAITDATYARYLVNGDAAFATKHLDVMRHIFHLWDDHFDFSKDLYFIEPLLDATEYTISSIDASGGKDGFIGGHAFRPTINAYMYANAMAISKLAAMKEDRSTSAKYAETASRIKSRVEESLWNPEMQHFVDRFQVNNEFARYWDFVRGRELEGFVPWYYGLPSNDPKYNAAWKHLISPSELLGPHGLRTSEPSFQYYMKQFRYDRETRNPECQWNGPSWPFQTTQALGGMINLLNNYSQEVIRPSDFIRILKLYTHQHYINGVPDLQEDYNPDTGEVIVGLPRSHHYNHSGYVDLVITGLMGLRPRADDVLEVNPLIPADSKDPNFIRYFCLENVLYHGHLVTILYDYDGKHYGKGAGLSIYVDGARRGAPSPLGRKMVAISAPKLDRATVYSRDLAVNIYKKGFPVPSASANNRPESLYQSIDGRVRFFPEVPKGWNTLGSHEARDWYAIDLGQEKTVSSVALYFYDDGRKFRTPKSCAIQYWDGHNWIDLVKNQHVTPVGNGETKVVFSPVTTERIRAVFENSENGEAISLVEFKVFEKLSVH
jgi:hypothetical protein